MVTLKSLEANMLTFGHATFVIVIHARQVRKDTAVWDAELDLDAADFVIYMLSFSRGISNRIGY
jgi:hypothetical protein